MGKLRNSYATSFQTERTEYDSPMGMNPEQAFHEYLREFFQIGDYFHVVYNFKNSTIEFCGSGIIKILGYDPAYFSEKQFFSSIHPADLPIFLSHEIRIHAFCNNQRPENISKYKFHYDFRVKNIYGVYKRLMREVVRFGMDDTGTAVRTLSVYTDISYLKRETGIHLSVLGLEDAPSHCPLTPDNKMRTENPFTERELQVLKSISAGMSVKEVALKLNLSESTVNNHRFNMLRKAGVKSCTGLLGKAIRNGWIK